MAEDDTELTFPWSVDDLLDDDPLTGPSGAISTMWTNLHHHLHNNEPRVVAAFCAAARQPDRTTAKLVALHLASVATGEMGRLIDELITADRLLYAHYRGSKLMATALTARWSHLDAAQRAMAISHIEATDIGRPSFANTPALIAAIPKPDRPRALGARLVDLGGPRPSDEPKTFVRAPEDKEPPPMRSLAEQMAEIPTLLAVDPIPWGRISVVLLEDERAQHADPTSQPARLLTSETARLCAQAAFDAMTAFERTPNNRDDIVHIADIAAALPPHHEDDAMNARLIDALRANVFTPPLDISLAVRSFSFVRPWHWRRPRGRALLLDILRDVGEPRVVKAALRPLYYTSEDAIRHALTLLVDPEHDSVDQEVAREIGQLLGSRAPWVTTLADLLRTWLVTPPLGRFLSTETAWNAFLCGAAFALKNTAHHSPDLAPASYAELAAALWTAWQSPRSLSGGERHGMALFLMSPLHQSDHTERIAARYWPTLKPLFERILTNGDGEEVSGALFHLDLEQLAPMAAEELATILSARARNHPSDPDLSPRDDVAQVLGGIAMHDSCTHAIASDIHQTLVYIGARKEALDVERRWAGAGR
jgi:hypothetical protein